MPGSGIIRRYPDWSCFVYNESMDYHNNRYYDENDPFPFTAITRYYAGMPGYMKIHTAALRLRVWLRTWLHRARRTVQEMRAFSFQRRRMREFTGKKFGRLR